MIAESRPDNRHSAVAQGAWLSKKSAYADLTTVSSKYAYAQSTMITRADLVTTIPPLHSKESGFQKIFADKRHSAIRHCARRRVPLKSDSVAKSRPDNRHSAVAQQGAWLSKKSTYADLTTVSSTYARRHDNYHSAIAQQGER